MPRTLMNEATYNTSRAPNLLINFVTNIASKQQCRFLCWNFVKLVEHLLVDPTMLETLEQVIDGKLDVQACIFARPKIHDISRPYPTNNELASYALFHALDTNFPVSSTISTLHAVMGILGKSSLPLLGDIIRDIVPYQMPQLDPGLLYWNYKTIPIYAQQLYETNYQNIALLADMLEDAGCTNKRILEHCRGNQSHYKGCWAVELVRTKIGQTVA